jgi:hypothetical protein
MPRVFWVQVLEDINLTHATIYIAPKTFNYLAFQSFDFQRT